MVTVAAQMQMVFMNVEMGSNISVRIWTGWIVQWLPADFT